MTELHNMIYFVEHQNDIFIASYEFADGKSSFASGVTGKFRVSMILSVFFVLVFVSCFSCCVRRGLVARSYLGT